MSSPDTWPQSAGDPLSRLSEGDLSSSGDSNSCGNSGSSSSSPGRAEYEALSIALNIARSDNSQYEQRIISLEEQLKEATASCELSQIEVLAAAEARCSMMEDRVKSAQAAATAAQHRQSIRRQQSLPFADGLHNDADKGALLSKLAEVQQAAHEAEAACIQLQGQLAAAQGFAQGHAKTQGQLATAMSSLATAGMERNILQVSLQALVVPGFALAWRTTLQGQLVDVRAAAKASEAGRATLSASLAGAQAAARGADADRQKLNRQVAASSHSTASANRELAQLQGQLEQVLAAAMAAATDHASTQQRLADAEETAAHAEADVVALNTLLLDSQEAAVASELDRMALADLLAEAREEAAAAAAAPAAEAVAAASRADEGEGGFTLLRRLALVKVELQDARSECTVLQERLTRSASEALSLKVGNAALNEQLLHARSLAEAAEEAQVSLELRLADHSLSSGTPRAATLPPSPTPSASATPAHPPSNPPGRACATAPQPHPATAAATSSTCGAVAGDTPAQPSLAEECRFLAGQLAASRAAAAEARLELAATDGLLRGALAAAGDAQAGRAMLQCWLEAAQSAGAAAEVGQAMLMEWLQAAKLAAAASEANRLLLVSSGRRSTGTTRTPSTRNSTPNRPTTSATATPDTPLRRANTPRRASGINDVRSRYLDPDPALRRSAASDRREVFVPASGTPWITPGASGGPQPGKSLLQNLRCSKFPGQADTPQ
ncbi:MAG: hypothetical protein WDW38_006337 [Sanguina aurantia]